MHLESIDILRYVGEFERLQVACRTSSICAGAFTVVLDQFEWGG